jgi:hypothetical protein
MALAHYDLTFTFTSYNNGFRQPVTSEKPEILLLEMGEYLCKIIMTKTELKITIQISQEENNGKQE